MCASLCEYGYFTNEDVLEATEDSKWGPFVDWFKVVKNPISIWAYKNKDYHIQSIKEGIELKFQEPSKRVLVSEIYYCSGEEPIWAIEVLSENNVKILWDYESNIEKILKEINLNYLYMKEEKDDYNKTNN